MASAPQTPRLPIFYNDLVPINSKDHGSWKSRPLDNARFLTSQHAVPLAVEEFPAAQRTYPIVFSAGDDPVPLALMGMNDGVNVYVNEDGTLRNPGYVPAFIRRYPFLLARLRPDTQELSLCVDPTAGAIGDFEDGEPLFVDGQPSEHTQNILKFCEDFERAVQNTNNFMTELKKYDLLMDGEVKIEHSSIEKPFLYQGFKMVNEEKLRELRGDELRKLNQSGMLPLLYAHLFSLQIMREVFSQQAADGKLPVQAAPTLNSVN